MIQNKINNMLIFNAEDFDIVMQVYNLLEYNRNYSLNSRILWNYYRDEIEDVRDDASNGKLIKYKK